MTEDKDLQPSDVQNLSSREAVALFFSSLGYRVDGRVSQTPQALGITAETLQHQIRHIERLADHENSALQVYLVELASVTVANIQGLARAFRNRAGNYLLVLTTDYEELDFVLLERTLPTQLEKGIATRQAGVRPRVVSVNRRNPGPVTLRALRRFTYTEADADYQFDKLRSAYSVAEWSERFFNNRALFSDYYLNERLRELPEWRSEDPKPAYKKLRQIYAGARERLSGKKEELTRSELLEPVFLALSFKFERGKPSTSPASEPDYCLYSRADSRGNKKLLATCLAYAWNRSLDGKDETRDRETPEENPGAAVVSILERGEAPWAIVTNGKLWRLYSAKAHSRATNYYEIDLEETLASSDPNEAFRYFWLLFRDVAFVPARVAREGETTHACFLDWLLEQSEAFAKRLGERLKDNVFEEVFPHFAEGFIQSLGGPKKLLEVPEPERQTVLNETFEATLVFLYRLLFLLYAESRDLLPVREVRGYWDISIDRLKNEVAGTAGKIEDKAPEQIKKKYRTDSTALYDRLFELCRVVDEGRKVLNVPMYNGGLFLTAINSHDESPEAKNARFLATHKIPDRFLALGLDRMARAIDEKRGDLALIDYKSLGVRQLGSIYEGLLEFKLRIPTEKMAVIRGKKTEEVIPYTEAKRKNIKILAQGRGKDAKKRIYSRGQVYLENDRRERKATGSYYTPDYIVKYIVEHAVGPVLEEKFEVLRPALREAERTLRKEREKSQALQKAMSKSDDPERKTYIKHRSVVDELFRLRVLDPAMGSGHFLVETVDFITDRMLRFLNSFRWNPALYELEQTRNTILSEIERQGVYIDESKLTDVNLLKRHVLKRCIYGVDLNPMAVELAKVSLWLDCFTLGAPLSFLDHHLKCGNSLIAVTIEEAKNAIEGGPQLELEIVSSRFAKLMLATDLMRHVGELSDVTADQVRESRAEYSKASEALAPFRRILDVYTSQWFGNGSEKKTRGKRRTNAETPALALLKNSDAKSYFNAHDDESLKKSLDGLAPRYRKIAETALAAAGEKRFFHWELEFPEVFFARRSGTSQAVERLEAAGFDAVIGNPPFIDKKHIVRHLAASDNFWQKSKQFETAKGIYDAYMLFLEQAASLCRPAGIVALLTPIPWLTQVEGDNLRSLLLRLGSVEILDYSTDPHFPDALVKVVGLVVRRGGEAQHLTVWRNHEKRVLELETLAKVFKGQFRIDVDPRLFSILEKIHLHSVNLETLYRPTFGLRALSKERGKFDKNFLVRPKERCKNPVRYLEARDIREQRLSWTGKWLDYQPRLMYNPRTPELFLSPKVLVPSLLSKRKLRAVLDDDGYFVDQSLVCISAQYDVPELPENVHRPSLKTIAIQLNSVTVSFYFAHAIVGEALGGGAIHATPGLIGKLSIFTQPVMEKATAEDVDELIWDICGLTARERTGISNWHNGTEGSKVA